VGTNIHGHSIFKLSFRTWILVLLEAKVIAKAIWRLISKK
jgi:hypothetical protein